jgi:hypothetical protein
MPLNPAPAQSHSGAPDQSNTRASCRRVRGCPPSPPERAANRRRPCSPQAARTAPCANGDRPSGTRNRRLRLRGGVAVAIADRRQCCVVPRRPCAIGLLRELCGGNRCFSGHSPREGFGPSPATPAGTRAACSMMRAPILNSCSQMLANSAFAKRSVCGIASHTASISQDHVAADGLTGRREVSAASAMEYQRDCPPGWTTADRRCPDQGRSDAAETMLANWALSVSAHHPLPTSNRQGDAVHGGSDAS